MLLSGALSDNDNRVALGLEPLFEETHEAAGFLHLEVNLRDQDAVYIARAQGRVQSDKT